MKNFVAQFLFLLALLVHAPAHTALAQTIDAATAKTKVAEGALLVDVRSPEEFRAGHVNGALNIPHSEVAQRLQEFGGKKDREIVLYCGSGRRAGLAQELLKTAGYQSVFNSGGYDSWVEK